MGKIKSVVVVPRGDSPNGASGSNLDPPIRPAEGDRNSPNRAADGDHLIDEQIREEPPCDDSTVEEEEIRSAPSTPTSVNQRSIPRTPHNLNFNIDEISLPDDEINEDLLFSPIIYHRHTTVKTKK